MILYTDINNWRLSKVKSLIERKQLLDGDIVCKDIRNIKVEEIKHYKQCHFFNGIGGWPLALQMSKCPEDLNVWTGSCPCTPFANPGKLKGFNDERHLWPFWFKLIKELRPAIIFGEQTSSKAAYIWLKHVFNDLEQEGYITGAADLPAASAGTYHIRQRLWFCAFSDRMVDPDLKRLQRWKRNIECSDQLSSWQAGLVNRFKRRKENKESSFAEQWQNVDWVYCRDGKWRPIEPGIEPLVDGISERVDKIKAYGDAIVPQLAKIFIECSVLAYCDLKNI